MRSYNIIPQTISLKGVQHKGNVVQTSSLVKKGTTSAKNIHPSNCICSRCVDDRGIINCNVISDGVNSISVKDLVSRNQEKIELIPLSLVINENTTECVAPSDHQAFNYVSVKVDVPEEITSFTPTKAILTSRGKTQSFIFKKSENIIQANDHKNNYLILIYAHDDAKNTIEFITLTKGQTIRNLKHRYGILILSTEVFEVESVEIFGESYGSETSIFTLIGDPFKQNLKILLSKTIK